MLDQKDAEYFNLPGAMVYDPVIGPNYAQMYASIVPFVRSVNNVMGLNSSFISSLNSQDVACGYKAYREKYLTFPPSGTQPANVSNPDFLSSCDLFYPPYFAEFDVNPCWNPYFIGQKCPLLWDVLSVPTALVYQPDGAPTTYFNREDVKKAMHAPMNVEWQLCNVKGVLLDDTSPPCIQFAIPQVIEATNRFLIANGDLDFLLPSNGTLLSIQNMTWNGQLGFQQIPSKPIDITTPDLQYASVFNNDQNTFEGYNGTDGPQGIVGIQHYERGLMWAETYLSGHMQPMDAPRASYRHLQWLLGHVEEL